MKIYSGWAFTNDEKDAILENPKEYKRIRSLCLMKNNPTDEELKIFTCVSSGKFGYTHTDYKVLSNPHQLSYLEIALFCDGGSLCFGIETMEIL